MNTKPMDCFGEVPEKSCQGCPYRLDCAQESSWNQLLDEDRQALEKHGLAPYRDEDFRDDYIPDLTFVDFLPPDDYFDPTEEEFLEDFLLKQIGFLTNEDKCHLTFANEAILLYNEENHPNSVCVGDAKRGCPNTTHFGLYRSGDELYGLTRFWEIYRNLRAGKATVVPSKGQSLGDLLRQRSEQA